MEEPQDSMVEEREKELMVSPNGGNPFPKKAVFLKPTLPSSSIDELQFQLPAGCFFSSLPPHFEPKKWPLRVELQAWPPPGRDDWKTWVIQMASVHQSTWQKAGIYEAILNSTYQIRRKKDLVYGFAEKWCSETNTFNFPWGEATITLEDVIVLGGFSVLGDSVLSPLGSTELQAIQKKLYEGRLEIYKSGNKGVTTGLWLRKFMNSGNEFEHEAFLIFWLSRYVFLGAGHKSINNSVFSIAIQLARGTRIALAPAVLASIYKDLGVLKRTIVDSNQLKKGTVAVLDLTLKSPLQLLQVWAWERFWDLRPEKPNPINYAQPRMARWDKVDGQKVGNLRMVLDLAGENFLWRPYALENWHLPKYYPQKEMWVLVGPDLDDELLSFVRCLRVSELVGLGSIEHYLPHRVGMQFGYDQDLPCSVTRPDHNCDIAWKHYIKEVNNVKLYLPSRLSEADVSTKYFKWWKQSFSGVEERDQRDERKKRLKSLKWCAAAVPRKKRSKSLKWILSRVNHPPVPPGFPPKCKITEAEDPIDEDKLTISELLKYTKKDGISFGISHDSDSEKLLSPVVTDRFSSKGQNLGSPIVKESSVNTTKSDKDTAIIVVNECASSRSLFEKLLLEIEKQQAELKARLKRQEKVHAELEAKIFGNNF